MSLIGNPLGLDLDINGVPTNSARNFAILEEAERAAEAARFAAPQYGGYPSAAGYQMGYPQQGYPAAQNFPASRADNYYPESRDRYMYEENRGIRHIGSARPPENYPRDPSINYSNQAGYGSSAAMEKYGNPEPASRPAPQPEREAYYSPKKEIVEPPKSYQQAVTAPAGTEEAKVQEALIECNGVMKDIFIPSDNKYHYTLLPRGLKEERSVIGSKLLGIRNNSAGLKTALIGRIFISNILLDDNYKGEDMNSGRTEDRFSEDLFKDVNIESDVVRKTIELEEIKYSTQDDSSGNKIVSAFSHNHIVNRFLQELSKIQNKTSEKAYLFDYVNATGYYAVASKNMFIKKAEEVRGFEECADALLEIFKHYGSDEQNINSLLTIDAELTRDFLIFIRGFSGDESLRLQSFMRQLKPFYKQLDSYVDVNKAKTIKMAVERFTNILFINLNKLKDIMSDNELNRIVAPRRELGIICRNNNIKNELAGTVASNENKFYYIDDMQTPELFALLESIDKDKTMAQYTRVLLYTISGLYQVIKSRQRTYYISAIDLYKPII